MRAIIRNPTKIIKKTKKSPIIWDWNDLVIAEASVIEISREKWNVYHRDASGITGDRKLSPILPWCIFDTPWLNAVHFTDVKAKAALYLRIFSLNCLLYSDKSSYRSFRKGGGVFKLSNLTFPAMQHEFQYLFFSEAAEGNSFFQCNALQCWHISFIDPRSKCWRRWIADMYAAGSLALRLRSSSSSSLVFLAAYLILLRSYKLMLVLTLLANKNYALLDRNHM